MTLTKSSLPILESVSQYKLWEKSDDVNSRKKKSMLPGLIMLLIGLLLIFGACGYYMFIHNIAIADVQTNAIMVGVGCLAILISGFMMFHRRKEKLKQTVEISADAADLVNRLDEVFKNIDTILDSEKKEIDRQKALLDSAINNDEIQLFSYLLEAKYSKQPDFAYEQLDEVEHYLAKQDVLIVPYSKGNERYFEFLDGEEEKTVRPALIRKGEVLAMGLAQLKTEKLKEEIEQ